MKMWEIQCGLGMESKSSTSYLHSDNQKAFDGLVNSGWEFGGEASAAAKTRPEKGGSMEGAASVPESVWMYQLTDKALALELSGKEAEYSKEDNLNNKSQLYGQGRIRRLPDCCHNYLHV